MNAGKTTTLRRDSGPPQRVLRFAARDAKATHHATNCWPPTPALGDQNGEHRFPRTTNTDFADFTDSAEEQVVLFCANLRNLRNQCSPFFTKGRQTMKPARRRP